MNIQLVISLITILAFVSFIFTYWLDATSEGFGSDKIFDSVFILIIGGILGGKFLFHPLSLNYLIHNFWSSPLILEGVLIGGAISAFIVIKKNNWSPWKIGDMIAPALSIFQFILFLGFYIISKNLQYLLLSIAFFVLFIVLKYLKYKKHFGTSHKFFELKRINKLVFTGGLIGIYLTVSSVIAILFLLVNINTKSKFWWFQLLFYLSIVVVTLYAIRRRFVKQTRNMAQNKKLSQRFLNKFKSILKKREKEIEDELNTMQKNDPFMVESRAEGSRQINELGDDVQELELHETLEAEAKMLEEEEKNIKKALNNIEKGTYGICEKCGGKIEKERLELDPTTTLCSKCALESEKS